MKYIKQPPKYYAIYRGDDFLFLGTKAECAKFLDVKEETITYLMSPANFKRAAFSDKRLLVIRIEEDDEDET